MRKAERVMIVSLINICLSNVVGLALIVDTVPVETIAESMGYVQLGMSAGTFFGPLLYVDLLVFDSWSGGIL